MKRRKFLAAAGLAIIGLPLLKPKPKKRMTQAEFEAMIWECSQLYDKGNAELRAMIRQGLLQTPLTPTGKKWCAKFVSGLVEIYGL